MGEEGQELPQTAEDVPRDRVFCTVYFFITEEGTIAGGVDYDGPVLGRLNVPTALGVECSLIGEYISRYARQALDRAGRTAEMGLAVMKGFGIDIASLESENDSKDSSEGSGRASEQQSAAN